MRSPPPSGNFLFPVLLFLLAFPITVQAQSTGLVEGQVTDQNGAAVSGAKVRASCRELQVDRAVLSDSAGRYQLPALPVGDYQLTVKATGFRTSVIGSLGVEVSKRITQNFQLEVGDISEEVTVNSVNGLIEDGTVSVGSVTSTRMVQELPLNGRFLLDLGLLAPGSVTPPQNGVGAVPVRGAGSFAINTAGNREESVNYVVNGITLNNLWFNSINFQPSLSSVQEFKLDNSTFSAEYGQSSGAVVNIATRSGASQLHGELFEYLRNDAFDARNFFDFTSEPPPFMRNQFGGSLSGPIFKEKTFFFVSYEGLRHRQGLTLNSLVLSDAERIAITDPVIIKLSEFIPRANVIDSSAASRFIGPATAPVNLDNFSLDVSHNFGVRDRLHGYYAFQGRNFVEPNRFSGNTIPGFGFSDRSPRQLLTLNETHIFGSDVVNVIRAGFNRLVARNTPGTPLNPVDLGIQIGVNQPIGLPQINVAGGGLNFGGPANIQSGRGDTTLVVGDTVSWHHKQHSLTFGGEFRQFLNNLFRFGTGSFNFPTVADFIAGTANSFSVTLGNQSSSVTQNALGLFVQDAYKFKSNLTFEVGLRYDWNITPTERFDRFIVFDPATVSLLRVGTDLDKIYQQNNKNFQPRFGFVWDPKGMGKTVVRAAYAILTEQSPTNVVTGTTSNPPLAIPLTFSGPIRLDNAIARAQPAGLAPQSVDHGFKNAYVQSWNLNLQHEIAPKLGMMVGYLGSKGTHLMLRRNLNQPLDGIRPYPRLSDSSPILPGTPLSNITQVESTGNSNYNAAWVTVNQRLAHGLQFNASYTWSKSLDYNSRSLQDVVVQDSYDLRADRGLSDYDARHRFVISGLLELPFRGNQFVEGWQIAAIVQIQSGNPVNIVTSDSTVNGVANTLRPDVAGPIRIFGNVDRWFDTSVFTAVARFGSLGRNVVIGPGFNNTDFSITKNTKITDQVRAQFRVEIFDLFNHPNFGQPGNVVGSPAFGRITNTRFPTGENGSSRQLQFALRLIF